MNDARRKQLLWEAKKAAVKTSMLDEGLFTWMAGKAIKSGAKGAAAGAKGAFRWMTGADEAISAVADTMPGVVEAATLAQEALKESFNSISDEEVKATMIAASGKAAKAIKAVYQDQMNTIMEEVKAIGSAEAEGDELTEEELRARASLALTAALMKATIDIAGQ